MHGYQHNMKGALFMMASMAGFVLNDTMIKMVSEELQLFQSVFLRGILATFLIGLLAWNSGALKFTPSRRDVVNIGIRSFAEMGATFCFLTALFHMPLANVTAILQSLPLAVALAASIFLGDKVGWRRYIAILIGFAGVMMIIRPGSGDFNMYSLLALAAVAFITLRELATRRLSHETPSLYAALATSALVMIVAGFASLTQEWRVVSLNAGIELSFAAMFILVGYVGGVAAMRNGEIAFVSPFRFSALIWAILIGMLVFGDTMDVWTLTGSAVVVATGVFTFYREHLSHKK